MLYTGIAQVLYRYHTGIIQVPNRYYTGNAQVLYRYHTGITEYTISASNKKPLLVPGQQHQCDDNNHLMPLYSKQPGESAPELSETLTHYTIHIVLKFPASIPNLFAMKVLSLACCVLWM